MQKPTIGIMLVATIAAVAAVGEEVIRLGDVAFPHELHHSTLAIGCPSCHHETEAKRLDIPHAEYFAADWSRCNSCHGDRAEPAAIQRCGNCHHDSPAGVADETLSAKVVIHRSCWNCHEVGTGQAASRACAICHAVGPTPAESRKTGDEVAEEQP